MLKDYLQMNKYIFERTTKRTFLSLYIVQFVCSINVLSKFNYFKRTLIRKNKKNKKNSKEPNLKEKNEFRTNVIPSNDLVPFHLKKIVKYFNFRIQ
jgi:hypothetical protein